MMGPPLVPFSILEFDRLRHFGASTNVWMAEWLPPEGDPITHYKMTLPRGLEAAAYPYLSSLLQATYPIP